VGAVSRVETSPALGAGALKGDAPFFSGIVVLVCLLLLSLILDAKEAVVAVSLALTPLSTLEGLVLLPFLSPPFLAGDVAAGRLPLGDAAFRGEVPLADANGLLDDDGDEPLGGGLAALLPDLVAADAWFLLVVAGTAFEADELLVRGEMRLPLLLSLLPLNLIRGVLLLPVELGEMAVLSSIRLRGALRAQRLLLVADGGVFFFFPR